MVGLVSGDYLLRTATPHDLPALRAIDDDAGLLYAEAGFRLELPPDHPFVVGELRRIAMRRLIQPTDSSPLSPA